MRAYRTQVQLGSVSTYIGSRRVNRFRNPQARAGEQRADKWGNVVAGRRNAVSDVRC